MGNKFKLSKEMDMGISYIEKDVLDLVERWNEGRLSLALADLEDKLMRIADKLKNIQNDGGNQVDEKSVFEE
jgi:hypothetical protein